MLSPERLDEAGDLVAGVYAEMETVMLLSLVRTLLSGEVISSGRTMTELLLLAQSKRAELRAIIDRYADRIDAATLATVREFLRESDEADVAVIGGEPTWPRQVAATVQGIAEVLDRDNLDMVEGAIQSFIGESARACTLVNTGVQTTERALHHAVRSLMRAGVPIVTYRDPGTGRQTVRNHVDVAVRRHIRTQISQDAGRVTLATMEHAGARFVEVTSHTGARPSHQVWQGRVYALDGPVTVDGVTYPDFGEGTGYYGTGPHAALGDRLCGVNCVIGDTVVSGPVPLAADRREYSGEGIVIHTALGHELTVTPNHPILTPGGWVPARLLTEGSDLFSACVVDRPMGGAGPDDDEGPSTIAEVFESMGDSFGVNTLLGSAADFHGDGTVDGDVDVVLSDSLLVDGVEAPGTEHPSEPVLHDASRLPGRLLGCGTLAEVGVGALHAAHGVMCAGSERGPLLGCHAGETRPHGIAPVLARVSVLGEPPAYRHFTDPETHGDIVFGGPGFVKPDHLGFVDRALPAPVLDTKLDEPFPDDFATYPELSRYGILADPGLVQLDHVVRVDVVALRTHVYNLQTVDGWYFANGIISHNCRHHFGPWVPGTPHRFVRDPQHPSGLDNDEVYQLTQDQRALERRIRADKRELAGMVDVWRSTRTPEALADVREAQRRLRADQQRIRDLIADANSRGAADVLHRQRYREWAGDMPEMP